MMEQTFKQLKEHIQSLLKYMEYDARKITRLNHLISRIETITLWINPDDDIMKLKEQLTRVFEGKR